MNCFYIDENGHFILLRLLFADRNSLMSKWIRQNLELQTFQ